VGIDNPIVEIAGGKKRHKYTPHTCRHTFATLMKRVPGADKDKQELIGHASAEQLRYYQDAPLDDLRKITNAI
jgi:integrase